MIYGDEILSNVTLSLSQGRKWRRELASAYHEAGHTVAYWAVMNKPLARSEATVEPAKYDHRPPRACNGFSWPPGTPSARSRGKCPIPFRRRRAAFNQTGI